LLSHWLHKIGYLFRNNAGKYVEQGMAEQYEKYEKIRNMFMENKLQP
jgi:hypothetical protein